MEGTNEKNIIWQIGVFKPYAAATVHVLSHSLHYGGAAIEGTRFYSTDAGPAVFQLDAHLGRLFYSAGVMGMKIPYDQQTIKTATINLIHKNQLKEGYIRHIVYYDQGDLRLIAKNIPVQVAIACWPWATYFSTDPIDITIIPYIRLHPKSTDMQAKLSGHTVNLILSGLSRQGTAYQEAIFLDVNGNIAEVSSANIFIIKDGKILTPKLGTILPGITRKTIIELSTSLGYSVTETDLSLSMLYAADEAFLTGTAVEVTSIRSVQDKVIGIAGENPISQQLYKAYMNVVHGRNKDFMKYLTVVTQ